MDDAAMALLLDADAWHKAAAAGIARVERYYTHPVMFGRYRAVYDQALAGPTTLMTASGSFSNDGAAQCPVQHTPTEDEALEEIENKLEADLIDELMEVQGDEPVAAPEVDIKL